MTSRAAKYLTSLAVATAAFVGTAGVASATVAVTTTTPYTSSIAMAATPGGGGYWIVGLHGGVYSFGNARFYGSLPGDDIAVSDIIGIASTPDGKGYWLYGSDGGVFTFGDARFYGTVSSELHRSAPDAITDFVPTSDGQGYWMVGADGGVFTFGDAHFHGSLPSSNIIPNPARIAQSESYYAYVKSSQVFLQPTPSGKGYWIVDSSGDVFAFGNAKFYGSLSDDLGSSTTDATDVEVGAPTTVPITGFVRTADGAGYWMAGTDGTVYAFGDAHSYGSLSSAGDDVPPATVVGYRRPSTVYVSIPLATAGDLVHAPGGGGYWILSLDGGVFTFGDAQFHGSLPGSGVTIDSIGP